MLGINSHMAHGVRRIFAPTTQLTASADDDTGYRDGAAAVTDYGARRRAFTGIEVHINTAFPAPGETPRTSAWARKD